MLEGLGIARRDNDRMEIIEHWRLDADFMDGGFGAGELIARDDRAKISERIGGAAPKEKLTLDLDRRRSQRDAEGEAIELTFGKRVCPLEIQRILGRDDKKIGGKRTGLTVEAHLPLLHRFQQGALCFWRRPVNFIGEQE